jgi:hypothetical protein
VSFSLISARYPYGACVDAYLRARATPFSQSSPRLLFFESADGPEHIGPPGTIPGNLLARLAESIEEVKPAVARAA